MNKEERYEKWKQKYINIPREELLNMAIIGECRRLDKADVYEWVYQDEMKIRQLMNNWNELKNSLKDELNTIKTTCSQVNGNYFMMNDKIEWLEEKLEQIQELEQGKDE